MKGLQLLLFVASASVLTFACVDLPWGEPCPHDGLNLYPDADHCSQYWECYHGCGTHMSCRDGFLYDDVLKWCEEPQKVYCGSRNCDGLPCKDEPHHNSTFNCPSDGYFADPDNCIKYYHCSGGISERLTCQKEGSTQLHYDPHKTWCNWPASVSCGNRPICDEQDKNCHQKSVGVLHDTQRKDPK